MTAPPTKIVMPEETLQRLKTAFCVFDEDGDGTITPMELGKVLRDAGAAVSPGDLKQLVKEVDYNGGEWRWSARRGWSRGRARPRRVARGVAATLPVSPLFSHASFAPLRLARNQTACWTSSSSAA